MANTDAAFGGRPVRYLNGSPWTGQARPYYVPSGYGVALYIGDPVVIVGDSNDAEFMGFETGQLSEVNLASGADATAFTGFIVSVLPNTAESLIYKPASTEAIVMVADDPNLVFWMQDDGSASLGVDSVGLNANLVTGTGSTSTGRSGWELDASTPSADASNQLFILAAAPIIGNDPTAVNAIWEVKINQQTYVASGADRGLGIA